MIFITGDTHGDIDCKKLLSLTEKNLSYDDYLIICGDAAICWSPADLESFLRLYNDVGCTILFVDGNHENFDMLEEMPLVEYKGALMHQIDKHIFHILRGEIMTLEGKTFFCLGGARSIDMMYRTPHASWWPQETINQHDIDNAIANLEKVNNKVDYVITHCCGTSTVLKSFGFRRDICTDQLMFIDKVVDYKHWFFGHYHFDRKINDKKTCLYQEIVQLTTPEGMSKEEFDAMLQESYEQAMRGEGAPLDKVLDDIKNKLKQPKTKMSRFLKTISKDGNGGPYHSFNKDYHLVTPYTKVIIVGTITSPQGRGLNKDFYYMSPYNPMYRIIDNYFKSSNLVKYKKEGDIPSIIEELDNLGIAFIDVIESCSNPKNSSLDDDLIDIKLDYEAFKDIDENIVMLANSNNAYGALLKIAEHNHLKNKIKYVYGFRFYKQEEWDKAFKDINL